MRYTDLIATNKDKLLVEFWVIIDNATLKRQYRIFTNLHCDYGIREYMLCAGDFTSKSKFNRRIAEYRQWTGFKMQLSRTNNDVNYTRLIYKLTRK